MIVMPDSEGTAHQKQLFLAVNPLEVGGRRRAEVAAMELAKNTVTAGGGSETGRDL
jgi:hypothetical protein